MKKVNVLIYVIVLVSLSSFISANQYPSDTNPLSATRHWIMNSSCIETLAGEDCTNVGCTATVGNITNSSGLVEALYCDGGNDHYIDLNWGAGDINYQDGLSICAKGNFSGVGNTDVTGYEESGGEFLKLDYRAGSKIIVQLKDGSTTITNDYGNSYEGFIANGWISWCMVFTPEGSISFYLNGTNQTPTSVSTNNLVDVLSALDIYILARNMDGTADLEAIGSIAEVMVWNGVAIGYGEAVTFHNQNWSAEAPPPVGGVNISINVSYPAENEYLNMLYLWINVSTNRTDDVYNCTINDTKWTLNKMNSTYNGFFFLNNTAISDGVYVINATCNESAGSGTTASLIRTFGIDFSSPTITAQAELSANTTILINNLTLVTNINFSDNHEIYSINISMQNESIIFSDSNMGEVNYFVNISWEHLAAGVNVIRAIVCDAHTIQSISDIDRIDYSNNGLKFVVKDNPFLQKDEWIYIYPKDYNNYDKAKTSKLMDRYTVNLNRKTTPTGTDTFIVESSDYIDISKLQSIGGHLIVRGIGKNGYWIDFKNKEATKYGIKRINDYKIEITVYGLKSMDIKFDSIGELNCVEEHYHISNLNPIETYESSALVNQTTTFLLDVHFDSLTMTSINATLFYNYTPYYTIAGDGNFSREVTAPSTIIGNESNISFNWVVDIDDTETNLSFHNQSVSDFNFDNCTVYSTNALNISLYNISTDLPINGTVEAFFEYSFLGTTREYSVNVGDDHLQFCIFPNSGVFTTDIHVDYSAPGSAIFSRFYNGTILSNESQLIKLYVSYGTTIVTFTVYDENDEEVQDAYIEIQEYDVGTGTHRTTEILKTGTDGVALGNLILDTTWYKFILRYQGKVVLETENAKITSTTKDFRIILGTAPVNIRQKIYNLNIDLESDKTNQMFNLSWGAISSVASEIWFNVTTGNLTSDITSLYSESSTNVTQSNIMGYHITQDTTNRSITYIANVYIISVDDGNVYFVKSKSLTYMHEYTVFGDEALFVSFLFVGTMSFIGIAISPVAALLLTMLGMIGFTALGFINIAISGIVAICVVLMILMVRIRGGY